MPKILFIYLILLEFKYNFTPIAFQNLFFPLIKDVLMIVVAVMVLSVFHLEMN
jgi:hypothetical protein